MSYDEYGIHDDYRPGRKFASGGSAQGVGEEVNAQFDEIEKVENNSERGPLSGRSKELIAAADLLESASDSDLRNAGIISVSEGRSISFSGMLPYPDVYYEYEKADRERICRWNDAFTVDESKRQDRLVDHEIAQAKTGAWMSFAMYVLCFAAALFAQWLFGNPWFSGMFVSAPILMTIVSAARAVYSKSSARRDSESE